MPGASQRANQSVTIMQLTDVCTPYEISRPLGGWY